MVCGGVVVGEGVNFRHLRQLNDLFEHRHDALILLCLARATRKARRPLHFRELAKSIIEQTETYMAESDLSRSLPRLRQSALVTVHDAGSRRPSYEPTPLGEQKAALLVFILQAIENRHGQEPPEPDGDNGDPEDDA
jgi:DNA-binding HxlR family transcriptional regulator